MSMTAPINTLRTNVAEYNSLVEADDPKQAPRLQALAGEIQSLVGKIDKDDLQQLKPRDLAGLEQILSDSDKFKSLARSSHNPAMAELDHFAEVRNFLSKVEDGTKLGQASAAVSASAGPAMGVQAQLNAQMEGRGAASAHRAAGHSKHAKFSPESNEAVADLARSLNGFNKKSIGAVDDFIEQLPNNSRLSRGLKREISTISSMRMGVEIEREGFADTSKGKLDDVLIYLRDPSARTNLNSKQKAMLDQAWSQWQSNPDNAKRLTSEVLASLEIPKTSTYNTLSEDAHKELAEHLDATKAAIADISQIDTTPGADEAKKAAIGEQMAGVLGVPGDIGKWKTDPKVQKLLESMPDDGRKTITDLYEARDTHAMRSDNNYNQLMGLLNSGLPMEAIIMAVMLLLTENEEDKYKLKMRELGGSELVNKLNKDLESNLRATSASPAEAMKAFQEQKIEPADLGLSAKSTTILMQEMQASMQIFSQMLQMLSGVMRQLQEMTMTPIRNIR